MFTIQQIYSYTQHNYPDRLEDFLKNKFTRREKIINLNYAIEYKVYLNIKKLMNLCSVNLFNHFVK